MNTFTELYNKANKSNKTVMVYLRKESNLNLLINETSYLPDNISNSERYYCWLHNLKEIPKCPYCNNYRRFEKVDKGYFATCGNKSCKSLAIGYANAHSYRDWNKIQEKMKNTYKERTGYDHNMRNPDFVKKQMEQYQQLYGVSCPVQSQLAKENKKKTDIKRKNIKQQNIIDWLTKQNYTYISNTDKIYNLICNRCNTHITVSSHLLNKYIKYNETHFCHKCDYQTLKYRSNIEKELVKIIQSFYTNEIMLNTRCIVPNHEIDIYLPDIQLGIEINGVYWHSELFKDKNYHINKKRIIEQQGINLIQIWEDDWNNYKEIIINKIKNIIIPKYNTNITFSKILYEDVLNYIQKDTFIKKNMFYIGIYSDNNIIGFCSILYNKCKYYISQIYSEYIINLQDLCNYLYSLFNIKEIYAICDYEWYNIQNNIFTESNFSLIKECNPNYYWCRSYKREDKNLFNKNINEMHKLNYKRVYNSGYGIYLKRLM